MKTFNFFRDKYGHDLQIDLGVIQDTPNFFFYPDYYDSLIFLKKLFNRDIFLSPSLHVMYYSHDTFAFLCDKVLYSRRNLSI